MANEIKSWKTQSAKHKIAIVLMMDGVAFSYNEEDGIVFSAPKIYVDNLVKRLLNCYGVSMIPNIVEII